MCFHAHIDFQHVPTGVNFKKVAGQIFICHKLQKAVVRLTGVANPELNSVTNCERITGSEPKWGCPAKDFINFIGCIWNKIKILIDQQEWGRWMMERGRA